MRNKLEHIKSTTITHTCINRANGKAIFHHTLYFCVSYLSVWLFNVRQTLSLDGIKSMNFIRKERVGFSVDQQHII